MGEIIIVTGPPCAGKSTYVRDHAQPGDVTIDFDQLAVALGSPNTHGHNTTFLTITTAARRAAIDAALRQARLTDATTWIIDANLHPIRRRIYAHHHAQTITLHADPAELHRRADASGRPATWHQLIDNHPSPHGPE